ncbi:lpg1689 family Dot/Icm T4SS effector [Legionella saoudiensis]|uniref:hypothetical protein n=1 Tax=Legionella saoudiensis TaxID=1750561 RepID=UPI000731254B|nr:hypothetical protein [Legionella saoudiensis]
MAYSLFNHIPTRKQVELKISEAKQLLIKNSIDDNEVFFLMLDQRISDFTTALDSKSLSQSDKTDVLLQYNRFAKTLYNCFNHPTKAQAHIESYFKQIYYPVGVDQYYEPGPVKYYGSIAGTTLGAALILASMAAFAFSPLTAAVLLPIGITILTPSLFALCVPEMLDPTQKKIEERLIFDTGVSILQNQPNVENDPLIYPERQSVSV